MYDLLKFNADLHTRAGRYIKLNLACPRFNRETEGGKTFSVSATRLWNQLPINLKKKGDNSCFLHSYRLVDQFHNPRIHFNSNYGTFRIVGH